MAVLQLILSQQRADTLFVSGLRALLLSSGRGLDLGVAPAGETGFVPRIEESGSGRWLGVLEEQDGVLRASEALALGACGVVTPDMGPDEFDEALSTLSRPGAAYVPAALAAALGARALGVPRAPGVRRERLTHRELQVLALVAQGESNAQIARTLGVSVNTVRTHLRSLFMKLEVTGRTMLIREAWELGLSEPVRSTPRFAAEPAANGWRQRTAGVFARRAGGMVPKVGVEPTRA